MKKPESLPINIYDYEPVCKKFSENWNLLIKSDYKDVEKTIQ